MLSIILIIIGCVGLWLAWWAYNELVGFTWFIVGALALVSLTIGIVKVDWNGIRIWLNELNESFRESASQLQYEQYKATQSTQKEKVWVCRDKWFSLTNAKECKWEEK